MDTKRCVKCGNIKSILQFNFRSKIKNRRNARCKECTRNDIMTAYFKRRTYYVKQAAIRNQKRYEEAKIFIYKYLSEHFCVDCGNKDPRVLQFDHVRGTKKRAISELVMRKNTLSLIIEEIKKCDVRCANCHMIKTARERGYYVPKLI